MSDPDTLNRDLPFRVGDWRVDPLNNQLHHDNSNVRLEPKVMDVLIYLAMRPGHVVSREELEEHVWAGRVVTYDAVTATIVKLRKAFQDGGQSEPIIKTISKRGYCLVAPIYQSPAEIDTPEQDTTFAATAPAADEQPETSDRPEAIEADNALPEKVQRPILTLRILLLGATLLIVLAISIVYRLPPPPANDAREATPTADKVTQLPQTLAGGTTDLEAQNSFNAGWQKFSNDTPADYKSAIALMQRAILLDPDYGHAHAALAAIYWNTWKRSWHILIGSSPLPHTLELTDAALQRAMQHPTPLAYQVSSEMLYMNRRYDEAINEARKAITLAPNNPLGHVALANALVFAGLPEQAKASIDKAMQLDPHHPPAYLFTLGLVNFTSGHYDKAAAILEQAARGSPQDHLIYVPLIAAYGHLGHIQEVAPLIREANRLRKTCQLPLLNVSLPIDPYPYNPWPFKRTEDVTRIQEGLRASGLPEY